MAQAAVNGSAAGESDAAFPAGDVLVHSPNDGTALEIVWTAPSSGTVTSWSASVWYAHPVVSRSNTDFFDINGAPMGFFTVSSTACSDRSDACPFAARPFNVAAGDTLAILFYMTAGQEFGSLNGLTDVVDFAASATPLPAALPLFVAGLGSMGLLGWRRKRRAQAPA